MRPKTKTHPRKYLVARGAPCLYCHAHGWKAFREPEERDLMTPCTKTPIISLWAKSKREAVATVRARLAAKTK